MAELETDEATLKEFFDLTTWAALDRFIESLNDQDPFEKALRYYAQSWERPNGGDQSFDPGRFLSQDRAAVYSGKCPVIFDGTNNWARKCYAPYDEINAKLSALYERCARLRKDNPDTRFCLILIPEKDIVISDVLRKEDRFAVINQAVETLKARLETIGVPLIFNGPILRMGNYQTLADFEYPDSHLAPRNYVIFFSHALAALDFDWQEVEPRVRMTDMPVYYDLVQKFSGGQDRAFASMELDVQDADIQQVSGSASFETPLGQTQQSFENGNPVYDASVLILGDSHSSILAQRRLTYLFASAFRKTDFSWNPACIRPDPKVNQADHVVLEVSLRFVV